MIREGDWVKYQQYGNTVYGTVEHLGDSVAEVECGERELYFNSQYLCEECWRDMLRAKARES